MEVAERLEGIRTNKRFDIKKIVGECNKSCMECLWCEYNGNSQFNLILQSLFNSWKNLNEMKWKDINSSCRLH